MPSATRAPSWSGCGRATLSNLRTSVSSEASRKTTYGRMPRAFRSLIADFRSVENARLRISTTAASRGTAPLARLARSAINGSRSAGRLSATNQSRSSSALAAVLRPAPDRPVMMTISCCSTSPALSSALIVGPPWPVQCLVHSLRGPQPESGQGGDLVHGRRAQLPHGAELPQQRSPPGRPEARHAIKLTRLECRRSLRAVICDGEPVRLVANALKQVQALTGPRQDDRAVFPRQPHFLQPLGQAADRDVDDTQIFERADRGADLCRAAIDNQQVRRVGELAARLRVAGRQLVRVGVRGRRLLIQVPAEPPRDHLIDGSDVIGAINAPDREPAVLRLAGKAILEDDHRGDHVRAL